MILLYETLEKANLMYNTRKEISECLGLVLGWESTGKDQSKHFVVVKTTSQLWCWLHRYIHLSKLKELYT